MAGNEEEEFVFASYEEAEAFIKEYEEESGFRHIRLKSRKEQKRDISSLDGHRLMFSSWSSKGPKYSGHSVFITLQTELRECMHGVKRGKKKDCSNGKRNRALIQNTRKMGCKAQLLLKTILYFPEYTLPEVETKHRRTLVCKKLKEEFSSQTRRSLCVLVKVQGHHINHATGEAADFNQPIDPAVAEYIRERVQAGVRNVDDMLSRINEMNSSREIRISNRRYYPSRKTVYNIMYNEINSVRHTKNDQVNTGLFLENKKKDSSDCVFFRPASDPDTDPEEANSLLFVHQSKFQREILMKYKTEVAILDATYNTCKFEVPLYMLAVQTNCGFVVVASFIIGRDSKVQVEEALDKIKSWNPSWQPKYFLTDYDWKEIACLEKVFTGSKVFLCQFHVIQAWKRWLSGNKEILKEDKTDLLKKLREICSSDSEEVYEERVRCFKETEVFKSNPKLRGWLETRWFPEHKRWVDCYRECMTLRNDTTNGLEVQHRVFKENFMKKHGFGGTLLAVVQVLVDKYSPAMEIRYKESNAKAMGSSKLYAEEVPEFLRNRPKLLVNHCLNRMPPAVSTIEKEYITFNSTDSCSVLSPDSGATYTVTFMHMYPKCSCPDFKKKHWPCKHLLGVMSTYPEYSWENLSTSYTGQSCFNLDYGGEEEQLSDVGERSHLLEHNYFSEIRQVKTTDEETCLSARKKCLSVTKEITNDIYCLDNMDVLNEANEKLLDVSQFIRKHIPRIVNLRIHKKKLKTKTGKTRKYNNKSEPKSISNVETEITYPDIIGPGTEEIDIQEDMDEHERALYDIWARKGSEELVMEVGPFKLTVNSFHYLKTRLSDELIDAYMNIMVKGTNVLHLCCATGTEIFGTGDTARHGYLRSTVLSQYERILCPVNEGGDHWVLVIVETEQKKLIYINPLGELQRTCVRILQHWYQFLNERREQIGVDELSGQWRLEEVEHSKQLDGSSCGLYTLVFAEQYLKGEPLNFSWNEKDLMAQRVKIGQTLLSSASKLLTSHEECAAEEQAVLSDTDDCKIVDSCGVISTENAQGTSVDTQDGSCDRRSVVDTSEPAQSKGETVAPHEGTAVVVEKTKPSIEPEKKKLPERRKGKRKLSSFVYPQLKRRKRKVYCVCQKPYDSQRFMIQCDECEEWFHLDCIGMEKKDIPKKEESFFCKSCMESSVTDEVTKTENVAEDRDTDFVPTTEWQTVKEGQRLPAGLHVRINLQTGLNEAKLIEGTKAYKMYIEKCKKAPESSHEFSRPEIMKPVEKSMVTPEQSKKKEDVLKKLTVEDLNSLWSSIENYLESIAVCTDNNCDKPEHQRHHSFTKAPMNFIRKEKKLFGFGSEMFDSGAADWLHKHLQSLIIYNLHPTKPATSARIPTLPFVEKKSQLYSIFAEFGKKWLYEVAEQKCLASEMDSKLVFGK